MANGEKVMQKPLLAEWDNMQIAVIGAGVAGTRHGRAFSKLGADVRFYDPLASQSERAINDIKKSLQKEDSTPQLTIAETPEAAMKNAHLVIIATPDDMHTKYAIQAVQTRTTLPTGEQVPPVVFVEKPFTTSMQDARRIQKAAEKNRADVVSGSIYSLTPAFLYIYEQLAQQQGSIRRIEADYRHNMEFARQDLTAPAELRWRERQNLWWGGAFHAFTVMMDVMHDDQVIAVAGSLGHADHETRDVTYAENGTVIFDFQSGTQGVIQFDGRSVQEKHGTNLQVWGSKVDYFTHNKDQSVRIVRETPTGPVTETVQVNEVMTVDILAQMLTDYLYGKRDNYAPMRNIEQVMQLMTVMSAGEQAMRRKKTILVKNRWKVILEKIKESLNLPHKKIHQR